MVGAEKFNFSISLKTQGNQIAQGNQTFWRDIPGFCRDIPSVPAKFEKKSLCSIVLPLTLNSRQRKMALPKSSHASPRSAEKGVVSIRGCFQKVVSVVFVVPRILEFIVLKRRYFHSNSATAITASSAMHCSLPTGPPPASQWGRSRALKQLEK